MDTWRNSIYVIIGDYYLNWLCHLLKRDLPSSQKAKLIIGYILYSHSLTQL